MYYNKEIYPKFLPCKRFTKILRRGCPAFGVVEGHNTGYYPMEMTRTTIIVVHIIYYLKLDAVCHTNLETSNDEYLNKSQESQLSTERITVSFITTKQLEQPEELITT